jgi:1-phosphatidylinositol-4-phosphate 5-kinase
MQREYADTEQYGTIKRLENFWKGFSHDKTQISPVPSIAYGDRFINFISGVIKTREQAVLERTVDPKRTPRPVAVAADGAASPAHNAAEDTVHAAEVSTERAESRGHGGRTSEIALIDHTLSTTRSPSRDRASKDDRGMTLPIVDEAGEAGEAGGAAAQSQT